MMNENKYRFYCFGHHHSEITFRCDITVCVVLDFEFSTLSTQLKQSKMKQPLPLNQLVSSINVHNHNE